MTLKDLSAASAVQLRSLIESSVLSAEPDEASNYSIAGISPEQQALVAHLIPAERTRAAVLIPLVMRESGLHLLFTQRATHMRRHAGQISFPGGRIEPGDANSLAAALRETEEEIGLPASFIHPVGYLSPLVIFTGYHITPVVGFVQPGFTLRLDEREVAGVFEVPFTHFLDPANHHARDRVIGDAAAQVTARVYDFPYGEQRIWGATAGIIMSLYRRILSTTVAEA